MSIYSKVFLPIQVGILLLISACGPTVISKLPSNAKLPASVAVLPPDYSIDMPRERIEYIRKAVISELKNANFVVIDDKVVLGTCSSFKCDERKALGYDQQI